MLVIIPILSVPQLSLVSGGNELREAQVEFTRWPPQPLALQTSAGSLAFPRCPQEKF